MFLFKKPKYEVLLFFQHEKFYKEKFAKMQNEGWEIAGEMSIKVSSNGYDKFLMIPLKRKLN